MQLKLNNENTAFCLITDMQQNNAVKIGRNRAKLGSGDGGGGGGIVGEKEQESACRMRCHCHDFLSFFSGPESGDTIVVSFASSSGAGLGHRRRRRRRWPR